VSRTGYTRARARAAEHVSDACCLHRLTGMHRLTSIVLGFFYSAFRDTAESTEADLRTAHGEKNRADSRREYNENNESSFRDD